MAPKLPTSNGSTESPSGTGRSIDRPRSTLKDGLTPIVDELVRRGITLAQARREFERQLIEASIRSTRGNLGRAARSLGVHRNTLRNKVTDLGIEPRQVLDKPTKRS